MVSDKGTAPIVTKERLFIRNVLNIHVRDNARRMKANRCPEKLEQSISDALITRVWTIHKLTLYLDDRSRKHFSIIREICGGYRRMMNSKALPKRKTRWQNS